VGFWGVISHWQISTSRPEGEGGKAVQEGNFIKRREKPMGLDADRKCTNTTGPTLISGIHRKGEIVTCRWVFEAGKVGIERGGVKDSQALVFEKRNN